VPSDDTNKKQKKDRELQLASSIEPTMVTQGKFVLHVNGEADDAFSPAPASIPASAEIPLTNDAWNKHRQQKLASLKKERNILARSIAKTQKDLAKAHVQHVFVATRSPTEIQEHISRAKADRAIVQKLQDSRESILDKIEAYEQKADKNRSNALNILPNQDGEELTDQQKESKEYYEKLADRAANKAQELSESTLVYLDEELAAWQGRPLSISGKLQKRPERPVTRLLEKLDALPAPSSTNDPGAARAEIEAVQQELENAVGAIPESVLTSEYETSHGTIPAFEQLPPVLKRSNKRLKSVEEYTTLLEVTRGRVRTIENQLRKRQTTHKNVMAEIERL